jgi:hypothetical protein
MWDHESAGADHAVRRSAIEQLRRVDQTGPAGRLTLRHGDAEQASRGSDRSDE